MEQENVAKTEDIHPTEQFVKEFKETQDHIYDKGYWAGRSRPLWMIGKAHNSYLVFWSLVFVGIAILVVVFNILGK